MRDTTVAHRILVIHEDATSSRDLGNKLVEYGYGVAGMLGSVPEAISAASLTTPDLVLMSLGPEPGGNAAADATAIRERWQVPVVYLTHSDEEAVLRRSGVTGPFGFVVAPYAERELRMNIEMALLKEAMANQAHELEDQFFAVAIDMVCFLDFSGYFKRLNPAWERTLGFTRAELMSKPFIEFVHPEDRERTVNQNRTVRDGGQARAFENRYVCKDGSYRWLMWNAAPDADRRVVYAVARDITDRKQAEEERERTLAELQAALEEVKTLQEILPICAYCKKIRDDENYWQTVEAYISTHTNATFSHGICPACYTTEVEPQFYRPT